MNINTNLILEKIIEYDHIGLYFHERPDADALGACFAWYFFIKINFPNKHVSVLDINKIDKTKINMYFKNLYINDNLFDINKSLSIINDTPTKNRVFSKAFINSKEIIKIDHHIFEENFANHEFINVNASSTCEMVAYIIKDFNLKVNKNIMNCLYFGILFDTNRFLNPNTNANTFKIVGWILDHGLDFNIINDLYNLSSINDFYSDLKLMKKIKFYKNIAYLIIKNKNIKSSKINLLSNFVDIKIWISCYYDYDKKIWFGSIRSREIPIVDVAKQYNGGGHKLAAGFKIDNKKTFKHILNDLAKLTNE